MALLTNLCGCKKNIKSVNYIFKKFCKRAPCEDEPVIKKRGENVKKGLFVNLGNEKSVRHRKVTICGAAGATGSAMAYTLVMNNYCDEVIMYDRIETKKKLKGELLDLVHGVSVNRSPKLTMCMDMQNTKDSDLIILDLAAPQKPRQTRLEIAQANIYNFYELIPPLAKLSPESVMLVLTNPSDIMTYACWKYSKFAKNRIIGTGTELDSSRFRYHIAKRLGINPLSVDAWIIGEHGISSVPVWSSVNVAGTRLRELDPRIGTCEDKNCWDDLHMQVVKDGSMVREMKGCTQYARAQISNHVAKSVLSNSKTVHAVSTQIKGLYGMKTDCFLSVPCIIGNRGIEQIVQLDLEDDEIDKLRSSAIVLTNHLNSLKFP